MAQLETNPTNHQHDEVLENILRKIYVEVPELPDKVIGLSKVMIAEALTALHSYIEKEKREARISELESLSLNTKRYIVLHKRGDEHPYFDGIAPEDINERLSALRISHDGKEG